MQNQAGQGAHGLCGRGMCADSPSLCRRLCSALGCSPQNPWGLSLLLACLPGPAILGCFLKYRPHFLFLHLLQTQITDESINYTNHYSEEHLSNCWTWTEQLVVNLLYNHCLQQESKCFNCANIMKGEVNHRDKFWGAAAGMKEGNKCCWSPDFRLAKVAAWIFKGIKDKSSG